MQFDARFGFQPYRFHVSLRNYSVRGQRMIYSFAEDSRNVANLVERLGATDYSLGIEVEGSTTAFCLGQDLRDYLGPELDHLEILPVFDEHKLGFYPYTMLSFL